ncbi:MAG: chemotaxis response regulator protein-glutamate methylesterase [Myxococcales bacterium]|nr:chemotaxis response regulator protein-glutamate methylesterase [Myxococcales bacterium]
MSGHGPVRAMVVDDSPVIRRLFERVLGGDAGVEVVATAPDPYVARDLIVEHKPDVVTLDIEMPRMDGLSFLRRLMRYHPIPVIIVSSLSQRGSDKATEALSLGAVAALGKPGADTNASEFAAELLATVKGVAAARVMSAPNGDAPVRSEVGHQLPPCAARRIVAVGASTGGTIAIERLLGGLPSDAPAVLLVQHMPPRVTRSFAERLDGLVPMTVREAEDGDTPQPGLALIAPGDKHMVLRKRGARYRVQIKDGPRVNHHRPSIDVSLRSVAQSAGADGVGVLLTGMGADGAKGLLAMRQAGAPTIAQDEQTSVVYGMPRAAAEIGAAGQVLPLQRIAHAVLEHVTSPPAREENHA